MRQTAKAQWPTQTAEQLNEFPLAGKRHEFLLSCRYGCLR
jgi:hypothetical protein